MIFEILAYHEIDIESEFVVRLKHLARLENDRCSLPPGLRTPLRPVELAWNFADEIIENNERLRTSGTKFLIPLPEPRLV